MSDQSISQYNTNPICRAWATTGDLVNSSTSEHSSSSSNQDRYKQKVRFNSAVKVVLIPTIEEYKEAQLNDLLWWCEDQYKEFKKSALAELKLFLLTYTSLDTKSALKIIYQPNENSEIEDIIHKAGLESMNSSVLKSFPTCSFDDNFNNSKEVMDSKGKNYNNYYNNNNINVRQENYNDIHKEEIEYFSSNSQEIVPFKDLLIAT